jgi:hypothetical protein
MAIFRFITEPSTVELDMRNLSGWYVAEGLDIGGTRAIRKYLKQDGVDGAELVKTWRDIVTMTVPLILTPQADANAMETLLNDLNAELRKDTNVIEYLPHGLTGTSYLIDTFRADEVSLADGQSIRVPWSRPGNGVLITIHIERQPTFRGRGLIA